MFKDKKSASQRIRVRLRSFDGVLVDRSVVSIAQVVRKVGCKISGPIPLPTKISKYTVLRSPHVNKKSREQFEMRTHKRLVDIYNPTKEAVKALTRLEIAAGVDIEIIQ